MIAAKICGVKIRIHTVAGLPLMVEKGMKLKLLEWIEKITYGAASNVWPNSNSLKEFILKHKFCSAKKLDVVGKGSSNGLDLQKFNPAGLDAGILESVKADMKYDPSNCYWLNVGRLVLDKGIVELVDAFTALKATNPNLKLVLVGQYEPDLDPVPERIVTEIKNNKDIIHLPWTERVEYFMALSHYYVFPTYREGFPNVLLEAAAMNLPIVCSEVAGNIDIVQHEQTGILFKAADTTALIEAMKKALADEANMKTMSASLQQYITANFGREQFWQEMLKEYNNLLHNKGN
jgi:glycosyltransferase involved in cell wall biosynthesis